MQIRQLYNLEVHFNRDSLGILREQHDRCREGPNSFFDGMISHFEERSLFCAPASVLRRVCHAHGDVCVCALKCKRAHRSMLFWCTWLIQGSFLPWDWVLLQSWCNVWIHRCEMAKWNWALQNSSPKKLKQTRNSSSCLSVTDSGLHWSQIQGICDKIPRLPVDSHEGIHFDWITERRPSSMHLCEENLSWQQICLCHCLRQHLLLCNSAWSSQRTWTTVLIYCHRHYLRLRGSREALVLQVLFWKQHETAGITPHVTICCLIKGFASAIFGKHSCLVEHHGDVWGKDNIHTTRKGKPVAWQWKAGFCSMHCDKRWWASRINRYGGARATKQIGQPSCRHTVSVACTHICIYFWHKQLCHCKVIHLWYPNKAATLRQAVLVHVVQHICGMLDKHPLLGIHHVCFRGRYVVQVSVKAVHILHEVSESRYTAVRLCQKFRAPSTMRDNGDGVTVLAENVKLVHYNLLSCGKWVRKRQSHVFIFSLNHNMCWSLLCSMDWLCWRGERQQVVWKGWYWGIIESDCCRNINIQGFLNACR